jgi:hypothetical protein
MKGAVFNPADFNNIKQERTGDAMKTIEIYEPPLCCPTGVCGPAPDPALVSLQDTILKLKKDGCVVERIAINQQPVRFMDNQLVKDIITAEGKESLPITLVDGKPMMKGRYPTYEELVKEVM